MNSSHYSPPVNLAIEYARSNGWVVVNVGSSTVADLSRLAQFHDQPYLLTLTGTHYEVRLNVDFKQTKKQAMIDNATDDDRTSLEQFLSAPFELLIVCNEHEVKYHTWPKIQFS